jgi:hypothetical protein
MSLRLLIVEKLLLASTKSPGTGDKLAYPHELRGSGSNPVPRL